MESVQAGSGFPVDMTSPQYFRKNKLISYITNFFAPKTTKGDSSLRDHYVRLLGQFLELIDGEKVNF